MMQTTRPVAIVTGAGAGIGRACLHRLAMLGYDVVALDVDGAAAEAAAASLACQAGQQALAFACDVTDPARTHQVAREVVQHLGRIDAMIGNAGLQMSGRLLDTEGVDGDRLMLVNLKGLANSCRAVLPTMIEQGSGSIVLVSSSNVRRAPKAMAAYDVTKAGVLGLMRSLAVDHGGDGIRVNAICPGATLTDHHIKAAAARGVDEQALRAGTRGYGLLGRVAEPAEIAAAIAFLAGPDASFITGATLDADGGFAIAA